VTVTVFFSASSLRGDAALVVHGSSIRMEGSMSNQLVPYDRESHVETRPAAQPVHVHVDSVIVWKVVLELLAILSVVFSTIVGIVLGLIGLMATIYWLVVVHGFMHH
jgi:hypothetical protein